MDGCVLPDRRSGDIVQDVGHWDHSVRCAGSREGSLSHLLPISETHEGYNDPLRQRLLSQLVHRLVSADRRFTKGVEGVFGYRSKDYTVSNLLYIPFTLIIMKYVFTTTMSPKSLTWLIELMHLASTLPTLLLQLQFAVVARFCCFAFVAMEKRIHTSDEVQLQRLASIHCKMCCLWNVFNNHFGPIILVTIGFFIALSMSYTYLFVSDSDVTWIELVRMGLRISYTLSSSMCAVYAVSRMRKEADSFNQTLKKVLFCRKYCSQQENLRLYIKMKIVVIPTACGFFQLRPTLFIKIFAGLLSYTVILLQFSGKSKIPIRADK
ncbi:uncharacterized protein [Halyomorpha halys]|uniref:uncharacterized protein isoform X3 n=1 Tax=Halyomorpha halys TaxID=286706 RepID=UPI0034D36795